MYHAVFNDGSIVYFGLDEDAAQEVWTICEGQKEIHSGLKSLKQLHMKFSNYCESVLEHQEENIQDMLDKTLQEIQALEEEFKAAYEEKPEVEAQSVASDMEKDLESMAKKIEQVMAKAGLTEANLTKVANKMGQFFNSAVDKVKTATKITVDKVNQTVKDLNQKAKK